MRSNIKVDSIYIDLSKCIDKTDPGKKCEHFTLRGYVSETRKKDWKKCWPFPVNESEEQPSLPPLDVPKFKWWRCEVSETGCEVNEVSNVEVAAEEEDAIDHTTRLLSHEHVPSNHAPVGNTNKIVKNDFQDHNVEKSTSLTHKRTRKMHLVSQFLSENCDPKMDKSIIKGSSSLCPSDLSRATKTLLSFQDKVDVQGDITLKNGGQGIKRKFLVDEESVLKNICFQRVDNEVQNLEGGAKIVNTLGKKQKKVRHVDIDLISRPPQGQQNESEAMVDIANKEVPSKSPPSGFFPHAFAEKRMDDIPLHLLREENDCNSKGKGKMLQTNKELDSLSGRKNDKLVEEGTSRPQLIRKDNETNFFAEERIPSNHISNAISINGNGVHLEEIIKRGNKGKTAKVIELDSPKRYNYLTTEDFEHNSSDDIPMEVIEMMARNQYERSMPNVKNVIDLLEKPTRMEKSQARDRENGKIRRQEDISLEKGNSVKYFSPLEGNRFGMNNLHAIQSSFRFKVLQSKNKSSSGVYISPIDTKQLGPTQTSKLSRSIVECISVGATLQAMGGSNLCKTIQQQDGKVPPQVRVPLTKKITSLQYDDLPKNVVSQPSDGNVELTSPGSTNSTHKENKKKGVWSLKTISIGSQKERKA